MMPIVWFHPTQSRPLMAQSELDPTETSGQWLGPRFNRFYFVWLALFSIVFTAVGFVPRYLELVAGPIPIAWVLNVHGAIMVTWLALFFAQAVFASTGRMALHRKLGAFGVILGIPVWASMVFVELRRKVVYPLEPDLSQEYDYDLPGIYIWSTFLIFFLSAVYQRHRLPAWHKRFMVFAALIVVQAAEMRITWLPRFAPDYWTDAIYLDICLLLPLLAYDYSLARRLHPATIAASSVLLGAQAILLLLWGSLWWRHLAYSFTVTLRSIF
jgi:hypothetical protein